MGSKGDIPHQVELQVVYLLFFVVTLESCQTAEKNKWVRILHATTIRLASHKITFQLIIEEVLLKTTMRCILR